MESQPHPVALQHWIAAILAIALLFAPGCATRISAPAETAASQESASETSPPSPSPVPEPTPLQPQPVYRITVTTEGGGTEQTVVSSDDAATDEAASTGEEATVTAAPAPTPSPTPKPGNFLSRTWGKIFPPKARSTPEEKPSNVIMVPTPREGLFSRLWHSIFPRKKTPPAALPPRWIGRIQLVNEQAGYALVDTQGGPIPPVGLLVRSVGNDLETGSLKISADREPPFFIADIEGGKPQIGDRVYSPETP